MPTILVREILISYPWVFWSFVYLTLRFFPTLERNDFFPNNKYRFVFKNKLTLITPWRLFITIVLGVLLRVFYEFGYRYESQIAMEVVLPSFLAMPYLRKIVVSIRLMTLCLVPLMVLTIIQQLWCTKAAQWSYLLSSGNRYLFWARENGSLWERMMHFGGPDYPMIELAFYPAYIFGTFAIAAVAIDVLPHNWRVYKPTLSWFFPTVFGISVFVLLLFCIWFIVVRHTIPFHGLTAFVSLFLSWVMVWLSLEVRMLTQTKLFVFGTLFSIFQTAIFEFYHAGIGGHWIYLPENELASLNPILHFKFPQLTAIGSISNSWPIEEWCAYPTLFVFVAMYLLFFHNKIGIPVLKHNITIQESTTQNGKN